MNLPKRHHYVPRFLLANFVDSDGKLWVKRVSDGKTWPAVPEDVFVERHRYSIIDQNGTRDPALERAYAELESATKPIIEKLLSFGRSGRKPELDSLEKLTWDEFLYHQIKRVPAVISALEVKKSWNDRIEDAIGRLLENGVEVDAETLADFRSPTGSARLQQNAIVKALTADSPLVRFLLSTAGIELGVAPAGISFAISSHPIAGVRLGLQAAEDGTSEMWLPIASDVAAKLAFGTASRAITLSPEKMNVLNRNSQRQGDFIAGNSEDLLKSIS